MQHGNLSVVVPEFARQLPSIQQQAQRVRESIEQIDDEARRTLLAQRQHNPPASPAALVERPQAIAAWDFSDGLQDQIGQLHVTTFGTAHLNGQALVIGGESGYAQSAPIRCDLREKTLEAWVILDNLEQRGGAPLSLQSLDGTTFDAIVFGEQEPHRWMAGSNNFQRTRSFGGPEETQAADQPVCIAIVFDGKGTVAAYRNGVRYGNSYQVDVASFSSGNAQVNFGLRHAPPSADRLLSAQILCAKLYDQALGPEAIAAAAGIANDYVSPQDILDSLAANVRAHRDELQQQLEGLQRQIRDVSARSQRELYTVVPKDPPAMRVHVRGSVTDLGDVVRPAASRQFEVRMPTLAFRQMPAIRHVEPVWRIGSRIPKILCSHV